MNCENPRSKTVIPDDKSNHGILLTIHVHPVILTETHKISSKFCWVNATTPVIALQSEETEETVEHSEEALEKTESQE